jgi:hypothetical protein
MNRHSSSLIIWVPLENPDDPRDTPPPTKYGEEIDLAATKEIILLVADQSVVDRVLADYGPKGGPTDWRVVSKDASKLSANDKYFERTPESFEMWGGSMKVALDAGNSEVAGNKPEQIGDMKPK